MIFPSHPQRELVTGWKREWYNKDSFAHSPTHSYTNVERTIKQTMVTEMNENAELRMRKWKMDSAIRSNINSNSDDCNSN